MLPFYAIHHRAIEPNGTPIQDIRLNIRKVNAEVNPFARGFN
jgi:hypothetical protein